MARVVTDNKFYIDIAATIRENGLSAETMILKSRPDEMAGKVQKVADEQYRNGVEHGYEDGYSDGFQEGYDDGFSVGEKSEYDRFWDGLQRNGEEYLYYGYAFANRDLWTQENIEKVKYKTLKANYVSVVFTGNTAITDLSMFRFELVTNSSGVQSRTTYSATFSGCTNLVKCMEINLDTVMSCPNMFNNCSALEELPVTGTLVATGLDLKSSTKLNKASITGIINALTDSILSVTPSITFSKTAVNNAFTDDEWTALAATKTNWTINLV